MTAAHAQAHQTSAQPPSQVARPDSIQDSGFYNYWANMSAQGKAGGVLLGKIAMEGEPLPWTPLLIVVDCKGSVVNMTQTDLQGRFVIRFVDPKGVEREPADSLRKMETQYEGCVVRGKVSGFRSNEKMLKVKNFRDEPDLGTITLSPEDRGGGMEVSSTTKSAPSNAIRAFEKARADWLEQNSSGAEKNLQKAVLAYPSFAEAWLQLGKLRLAGNAQGAKDAFSKAIAADPKFILPYEQLAGMAAQQSDWQEVLDITSKALDLAPAGTPQIWYYDALAKFQLNKNEEAQVSAQKGIESDPSHSVPNTEQLIAVMLARKGDYTGALEHLKTCLSFTPNGPNADLLKQQIAQMQQKAGK